MLHLAWYQFPHGSGYNFLFEYCVKAVVEKEEAGWSRQ